MSKLITDILNNATGEDTPKSRRMMKRIRRDRKLYFRDSNGSIRRLDKISLNIYDSIIVNFLMGDSEGKYQKLNKDVKHWKDIKPLPLVLLKRFRNEFSTLQKVVGQSKNAITIYYNGSWKPLVALMVQK